MYYLSIFCKFIITNHIVEMNLNINDASRKKEAFKSFLETNASPVGVRDSKKNPSDQEEVCKLIIISRLGIISVKINKL